MDGICGRQTELAILHFQKFQSQGGAPIIADGLVNVSRTFSSGITGMPYTIGFLNDWFRQFGNGNQFHGNLENHPLILENAPELQAELAAAQVGDEMINI
jgi:hypothetical protein